jgi:periplasmic protein TonB
MAVQILNDMPDAAVSRGDPAPPLQAWIAQRPPPARSAGRPIFIAITLGLHTIAALAFLSMKHAERVEHAPAPIIASIVAAPTTTEETAPMSPPPLMQMVFALPTPEPLSFEPEPVAAIQVSTTEISQPGHVVPPVVESVEYVRQPTPIYPLESKRRREKGTVLLRVLVDPTGRPAQIQVERSSGFERLDLAAREAVEKALFRPHEVNGVAQAAQVLIPIEFARRAS